MMRPILLAALFVPGLVLGLAPVPALAQVTPGQWTTTISIDSVDMPGAPAGFANLLRGRKMTAQHCLTPEEAAKGPQEMLKADKSCHFTRYSMAGGKLSSEMSCTRGGQTTTATTTGSFTSTSFAAAGRTVSTGSHPMTMTSTVVGTRTGDCK